MPLHTSDLGYEAETSSKGAGDKLEWTFYGPQYGDRKQKVEIEMICDANVKQERPEFRAYDLLEGEAKVYWRSQAACPKKRQSGGGGGSGSGQDSNVGGGQTPASSSGWGFFSWFFFLYVASARRTEFARHSTHPIFSLHAQLDHRSHCLLCHWHLPQSATLRHI